MMATITTLTFIKSIESPLTISFQPIPTTEYKIHIKCTANTVYYSVVYKYVYKHHIYTTIAHNCMLNAEHIYRKHVNSSTQPNRP